MTRCDWNPLAIRTPPQDPKYLYGTKWGSILGVKDMVWVRIRQDP